IGTTNRQLQSAPSRSIRSASSICTATSGRGWRIAIRTATLERRRTAQPDRVRVAVSAFCAAAPGSAIRASSTRPAATRAIRPTAATMSVSELPEHFNFWWLFHPRAWARALRPRYAPAWCPARYAPAREGLAGPHFPGDPVHRAGAEPDLPGHLADAGALGELATGLGQLCRLGAGATEL